MLREVLYEHQYVDCNVCVTEQKEGIQLHDNKNTDKTWVIFSYPPFYNVICGDLRHKTNSAKENLRNANTKV